jgi:formiminotetrahydrofolate cyclodeaminase
VEPAADDLLELRVAHILERLPAGGPAPGAGAVAALSAALAAALVGMVARGSERWSEARATAAQAEALRRRLAPLSGENAEAYGKALASLALPETLDAEERNRAIVEALGDAADVLLRVASAAADVALLAAEAARCGEPALRPDATVAAVLAAGAARAMAHLVEVNLTTTADDDRVLRSRAFAESAQDAARRLLDSVADAP